MRHVAIPSIADADIPAIEASRQGTTIPDYSDDLVTATRTLAGMRCAAAGFELEVAIVTERHREAVTWGALVVIAKAEIGDPELDRLNRLLRDTTWPLYYRAWPAGAPVIGTRDHQVALPVTAEAFLTRVEYVNKFGVIGAPWFEPRRGSLMVDGHRWDPPFKTDGPRLATEMTSVPRTPAAASGAPAVPTVSLSVPVTRRMTEEWRAAAASKPTAPSVAGPVVTENE